MIGKFKLSFIAIIVAAALEASFANGAGVINNTHNSFGIFDGQSNLIAVADTAGTDSTTVTRKQLDAFEKHIKERVLSRSVAKKDALNNCDWVYKACSAAAAMACIFQCMPHDAASVIDDNYPWSDGCNSCVDEVASQCIADSHC